MSQLFGKHLKFSLRQSQLYLRKISRTPPTVMSKWEGHQDTAKCRLTGSQSASELLCDCDNQVSGCRHVMTQRTVTKCWNMPSNFIFLLPCIVIEFFLNNQPDALIIQIYCYETLHVSGLFSAHHQEFSPVHSAQMSFMQVFI